MRIFIGIGMSKSMAFYLKEVQNHVLAYAHKFKSVRIENFHLTLKFIGEVGYHDLEQLNEVLHDSLENFPSFSIKLGQIGHFPKKDGDVLWVGITEGLSSLNRLNHLITLALKQTPITYQKSSFHPHVTIARAVQMASQKNDIHIPYQDAFMQVNEVMIYQSHNVHGILTYTPLYSIPFI